jgi:two-component system, OmpR family, KDP operon response regulator KdpE
MTNPARILVVEDEPEIRRFLRVSLEHHGFRLDEVTTVREAITQAAMQPPDLMILDLGLPDGDGLDVIKNVRGWSPLPIVVLSARGQEQDKVHALDAGADDYLTKPFGIEELLARVRVALRHAARAVGDEGAAVFQVGDLCVDQAARRVTVHDREVHFTPTEYKLLTLLVRHAGKVMTHRQLLKEVWGPGSAHETQYLRVFMAALRQKLEDQPAQPRYLLTELGVGYRLASE